MTGHMMCPIDDERYRMSHSPVIERFIRYVKMDTRADIGAPKDQNPSSPGQTQFVAMLRMELEDMGVDVEKQIVMLEDGSMIVRFPGEGEGMCLAAHVDTYYGVSGLVTPMIHDAYEGGDVHLPRNNTVIPAKDLEKHLGQHLITSSGDSVLGADDKVGVAIMMQLIQDICDVPERMISNPVDFWFCTDEEIGRLDISLVSKEIRKSWTKGMISLDGGSPQEVDIGCFCGWGTKITFTGQDAHPGVDGKNLKCAHYAAAKLVADLAMTEYAMPRHSSGMQPFIYVSDIGGNASKTVVNCHPRSFDKDELPRMHQFIKDMARTAAMCFGVKWTSAGSEKMMYVSTEPAIEANPALKNAIEEVWQEMGLEVEWSWVRGGTDGAMANKHEPDLAAPNTSAAMHNIHSEREFSTVEEIKLSYELHSRLLLHLAA